MIRIVLARTLPGPREAAFDYITDPRKWPLFWPDLVAVEAADRVRWCSPGDTIVVRMRLGGRTAALRMRLEEFRRPELVRYHSTQDGLPDTRHRRTFDLRNGELVYGLEVAFAPRPGVLGLFDRTLLRYAIRRALRRTVANLRRRLTESGTVAG